MITDHDADVDIRLARREWLWMSALVALYMMFAVISGTAGGWSLFEYWWLGLAAVLVLEMLWLRTRGVTLRRDAAVIRNVRTHVVSWNRVQAIAPESLLGTRRVAVYTDDGRRIVLRAPTASLGMGREQYERDYHRIGQWWLAHRGPDWQPVGMRS